MLLDLQEPEDRQDIVLPIFSLIPPLSFLSVRLRTLKEGKPAMLFEKRPGCDPFDSGPALSLQRTHIGHTKEIHVAKCARREGSCSKASRRVLSRVGSFASLPRSARRLAPALMEDGKSLSE